MLTIALALCCYLPAQSPSQAAGPNTLPPELVVQTGHSSRVNCGVFAPDNRWLATGSADNTIRLWDTGSSRELRALIGHTNWIKALAVSHRGLLLASGSNDHTIKLWDVSSGREVFTLSGHSSSVDVLAFSPDDRWLVSGSSDKAVKVWDVTSGAEVRTLNAHAAAVTALSFSPDGKTLASASTAGETNLWATAAWNLSRSLKKQNFKITALSFSPDSEHLFYATADGTIFHWDATRGRELRSLKEGSNAILALAFGAQSELLATSADGTIVFWDFVAGTEKRVAKFGTPGEELLFATAAVNGQLLATSDGSRIVQLRNASTGKVVKTLESHSVSSLSLAFSNDGRWLASGANDRSIRIWQTATGREMPKLSGHTGWVKAVAFSPDSRLLASGSNSGELKLWDLNKGVEINSQSFKQERIDAIAFSPDQKWVVAAGTAGTIHVSDLGATQSRNLGGHTGEITSLAFVPNSSFLASASTDKTIRLWDLVTGLPKTLVELGDQVNAIAFSPDGKILAAGTADHKITLLTMATGEKQELVGHAGEIFTLAFSPDGRWLASGGMDQTVKLWHANTGAAARTLVGGSGEVNSLAFSSDSRALISASGDGSMMLWNADSGNLAAVLISMPLSDDWLVATPGGLFDGSHAAWKFLLWRFAQSTFKVAPVESFFNEFYYPGLLADILGGKNPTAKHDIVKKDRRQPEIQLEAEEQNPPAGTVAERQLRLRLNINEAPADGEYSEASGARDLRLFRNGLLVQSWSGDVLKGSSKRTLETTVTVVAGANEFRAYAFNRDNVKSADAVLTLNGAESLRRTGTAYLIVVGVGSYANSQYNLNYSVADATEIGTQLKSQQELLQRYSPVEVVPLINEQATKENILLALNVLAGKAPASLPKDSPGALSKLKAAQPEDAVIFYFSGHGTAQDDRFYLIPHDLGYEGQRSMLDSAGLANILAHSISDLELEEALKSVDVDQLLLIIDACNSGQALKAEDERRGPMNARGLAQLAYEKGMYILTASQSDEVAFESAGLKHSYLAYALVEEGIKSGAADEDKDGQVFLKEWFDYATERVPRIGGGKKQTGKQLEEVDADEQRVQRPRVFNMREGGAERFEVARLARAIRPS
ncbi:MAG TPA: caspase family protein [Pyrinomonadaceae bacterium]|nr:caspase family protein [Pyrinomonadaceae bacterium]